MLMLQHNLKLKAKVALRDGLTLPVLLLGYPKYEVTTGDLYQWCDCFVFEGFCFDCYYMYML